VSDVTVTGNSDCAESAVIASRCEPADKLPLIR
jgi:hypothetical protein